MDELLLAQLTGEEGAKLVVQSWIGRCLPVKGKALTLTDACAASAALLASGLYKWSDNEAQGMLSAGDTMLRNTMDGLASALGMSSCPFLAKVHAALPDFFYTSATAEEMKVAESVYELPEKQGKFVREASAEIHTLGNLRRFVPYQHLLESEQSKQLTSMIASVMADGNRKRKAVEPVAKATSSKSAKPKSKAKKPSTSSALSSAADALLYAM
eukprot:3711065-Amphidinium_carterae.1